ncbi:MAG: hypothetical protein WAK55_14065 [Xanthobacteraceae bacterium]
MPVIDYLLAKSVGEDRAALRRLLSYLAASKALLVTFGFRRLPIRRRS